MIKAIIDGLFIYITLVGAAGIAVVFSAGVAILIQDCIQTVIKRGKRKFTKATGGIVDTKEVFLPYF